MPNFIDQNIRAHSLKLKNVRNVRNGEIVVHRGLLGTPDPDIVGIFGQNGSGKTTVVDSFSVLQHLMRGDVLPEEAEGLINMKSDEATLLFRFIVERPLDAEQSEFGQWEVSYELTLARSGDGKTCVAGERIHGRQIAPKTANARPREWLVSRDALDGPPIAPDSLWHAMRAAGPGLENEIRIEQAVAHREGRSFLFSKYFLKLAGRYGGLETSVLLDLSNYARTALVVAGKVHTGLIYTNLVLPRSFRHSHEDQTQIRASGGTYPSALKELDVMPAACFEDFGHLLTELNAVLETLIPGFSLRTEILSEHLNERKEKEVEFELMASRDDVEIPLRYESSGMRRLVSILSLLLSVYNDPGVCVVIDELDDGIFEYLLGQLIELLSQSGRGQLIFTAHNMRALEVLRPPQIVVTTTDAFARFRTLKSIEPADNIRSQYYERVSGDPAYYSGRTRLEIERAFQQVGEAWESTG